MIAELAVLDGEPAQPEPNWATPAWMKSSLNFSTPPRSSSDLLLELARDRAAALRLHPLPEVDVVVVLAGIVEEGLVLAEGALHDLLDALALEFGPSSRLLPVLT